MPLGANLQPGPELWDARDLLPRHLEVRKKRRCLIHEGSGNTGQRHCRTTAFENSQMWSHSHTSSPAATSRVAMTDHPPGDFSVVSAQPKETDPPTSKAPCRSFAASRSCSATGSPMDCSCAACSAHQPLSSPSAGAVAGPPPPPPPPLVAPSSAAASIVLKESTL